MPFNEFLRRVTNHDHGQRQAKRLQRICDAASVSIGYPMDDATRFEARLPVERLYDLSKRIEDIQERIARICQHFPTYRRLLTIPGFGTYVVSQVIARIGDPHRFAGRKQLIRLAGYDLYAKRSGKTRDTAVPVISKHGIKTKMRVKLAVKMLVIAWCMMRDNTDYDPPLLRV